MKPLSRAVASSITLGTLVSFVLNSAPHGELLPAGRLFWIGTSLLLYTTALVVCCAIPAHLMLRALKLRSIFFYLAAGIGIPCIGFALLYRVVNGEIWLGGMLVPLTYNAVVGLIVAPLFHNIVYTKDSTD